MPDDQVHSYSSQRSLPQAKNVNDWATKHTMQVQNNPSNVGSWNATQQLWVGTIWIVLRDLNQSDDMISKENHCTEVSNLRAEDCAHDDESNQHGQEAHCLSSSPHTISTEKFIHFRFSIPCTLCVGCRFLYCDLPTDVPESLSLVFDLTLLGDRSHVYIKARCNWHQRCDECTNRKALCHHCETSPMWARAVG